jgi:hypothetical protein
MPPKTGNVLKSGPAKGALLSFSQICTIINSMTQMNLLYSQILNIELGIQI